MYNSFLLLVLIISLFLTPPRERLLGITWEDVRVFFLYVYTCGFWSVHCTVAPNIHRCINDLNHSRYNSYLYLELLKFQSLQCKVCFTHTNMSFLLLYLGQVGKLIDFLQITMAGLKVNIIALCFVLFHFLFFKN